MSESIIEEFLETEVRLRRAIEGLDEERLSWKASPNSWSVKEVLGHLVDHSIVVSFRIRAVLAGTQERLPAFAQDAWVEGQHTNEGSAADILEAFHAALRYNGLLLRRLEPSEWEKNGINAQGGTVSIADIARGFSAHVERHLGQIDRIKAAQAEEAGKVR
ncbi:DinB family protein [Saccharibacillus sp. CPCC 101409]|uniref:DinB family protein n=1 Tax=Saccharibacillus sp. CPCC 101409 TaxID=3058041 RepID=UPI002673E682|nr:DinB family protein [Saccharibacillus sp. CPCC 101409]MDO3409126.1 DinB family protein [Saccharibacillus sp. CPCC 101409]